MRLVHEVSLVWALIHPMSLLAAEIASVIALSHRWEVDRPFWKHWLSEVTSAQVKDDGSALESLCEAGGHLPSPFASWY